MHLYTKYNSLNTKMRDVCCVKAITINTQKTKNIRRKFNEVKFTSSCVYHMTFIVVLTRGTYMKS